MRKMLTFGLIAVMLVCAVPPGHAQGITVAEIVEKANLASYYAGDDGLSDVSMTIKDAQGRERVRDFRILRYDLKDGGDQKFYVYFRKPTDVARMVYMVWKHLDRDDDRWLYLPALDLVRRIASSDKRSSFVGSHFVYEDVSGRSIEADTHELLGSTGESYQVRNTPKDKQGLEFAYYDIYVRKDNFLPVKAEYFNPEGKLIRTVEAITVQDIQGIPTVTQSKAVDVERGGETLMEFTNVQYDIGLKEDIFAERYLRRPPTEWVK